MPVMTAVLDDDDRQVLREVMDQLPGTYKNNPIPMPGSFFVNKLLKIYNEATVHPLSGNEYPMTGKTVDFGRVYDDDHHIHTRLPARRHQVGTNVQCTQPLEPFR